jgi:hypothetical protein
MASFARSQGFLRTWLGANEDAAGWVRILPAADTGLSIGDTLHFAATVTDTNGLLLPAARVSWSTSDSSVAWVRPDGSAIIRRPGEASIMASVRKATGRARLVVRQQVAAIQLEPSSGLTLGEGATVPFTARPLDARGHPIAGRPVLWRSADPTVLLIDSAGRVTGGAPGVADISASIDGLTGTTRVTVTPVLDHLALVSGGGQHVLAGGSLGQPVVVKALSRAGKPMPGVLLHLRIGDPRNQPGQLEPDTARTDPEGMARIGWTAGAGVLPGRSRLTAQAEGVDSGVIAEIEVEPIAANTRLAMVDSVAAGQVGEPLAVPLAVRAADSLGQPLFDLPVQWKGLDGVKVTPHSERTDTLGQAQADVTLGPKAGTQRIRISLGGRVPSLVLKVTARPGSPTAARVAGNGQQAVAGSALPHSVGVLLTDRAGNPVPGWGLRARVEAGGGRLSDSALTTDSSGVARVRWTLGERAGGQRVEFWTAETPPVLRLAAEAVAVPGTTSKIAFETPAANTPAAVSERSGRAVVVATDRFGNHVPNVPLEASASGGSVTPSRAVTDAQGRAAFTWTVGKGPGDGALQVRVRGTAIEAKLRVPGAGTNRGRSPG